jgi:DNA-binding response OmpR family regulator/nitrogen-specific signal transduction histidine kinase
MRTMEELEAARREAESARQAKSRFVANISHELRTPLNIITGFAEMLCTSPGTYGDLHWPPDLQDDLNTIRRNSEHLLHMVDDILDLAQIEADRLPVVRQPTDMIALISDTLGTVRSLLADSRLELRLSLPAEPVILEVDPTRIRQVLLNLISNAVRHTPSGYVEVGAFARAEELIVYVQDSGEGIPSDKLEVIFEEFERLDTSSEYQTRGIGLGLAIARHFVQMHTGSIWAESVLGAGSTFYFALPLSAQARGRAALQRTEHRPAPARQAGKRLLVLSDDDLVTRQLQRHMAEQFELSLVNSVASAGALVLSEHPDLVLVTADAPDTLTEALDRALSLGEAIRPYDVPILVGGVPTERRAGAALKVSDLLIKPVTPQQVISTVKGLCPMPRRILIVEDDSDMLRLLSRMVTEEWDQAEILGATTGQSAIALLARRPDVMLLDLLLPDINGVQVLSALRATPEGAATPVIVITARGPAEEAIPRSQGRLYLLRNSLLTTGELTRCVTALAQILQARYVPGGEPEPGNPKGLLDSPA